MCVFLFGSVSAIAAGPFDGTYTSTRAKVPGSGSTCPVSSSDTITIAGDKLTYRMINRLNQILATVVADVSADGSFKATASLRLVSMPIPVELIGKVTGSSIEADIRHQWCRHHLSLKKADQ
jgi:hypothetical protein